MLKTISHTRSSNQFLKVGDAIAKTKHLVVGMEVDGFGRPKKHTRRRWVRFANLANTDNAARVGKSTAALTG